MVNVCIFRALLDPFFFGMPVKRDEGAVFSDEFNHGSVQDGCDLTTAIKVSFKHDDLEDLGRKLAECDRAYKLIVTEGVFSLEGEITNVPAYVALARKYGAQLMVDDAHGVGILGAHGGGSVSIMAAQAISISSWDAWTRHLGGPGDSSAGASRLSTTCGSGCGPRSCPRRFRR